MPACGFESHGFRSCRVLKIAVPWSSGDDSWLTTRQRWFESIRDHSRYVLAEQPGVLATLSRWRPRVQIPSGTLGKTVRYANRKSGEVQTFVSLWVQLPSVPLKQQASAGHWRAQVAVTHPPSGTGGSTPSRRTRSRTARSSSGSGNRPLKPATRVRLPHGSLVDLAKWCNW